MKLVPTQTERTILLWLILAFMAMLVPQCWWTSRWDNHATVCKFWMLTYGSLLLTTCVISGTKRQVFVWLVSMLSLLVAHLSSPFSSIEGVVAHFNHIGCDATGLVDPSQAIVPMAVGCSVLFVVSFGISFLLDRFLGPLHGLRKPRSEPEPTSDSEEKRSVASGRIRLLIAAAVILFTAQAAGNLVRANFEGLNLGESFLIPATMSIVTLLCCGAICRLRFLPACFVGAVAVCALTGGGVAQAARGGVAANAMFLVGAFGFCSIMLASIFALLGNSKQPFKLKFGWLLVATSILACVFPAVGSKYDWHSLLLANPLDLKKAAFQKTLNSHPGVSVRQLFGMGARYEIVFESKDAEDFFNEFDPSLTPKGGSAMYISFMGPGVDLSDLKRINPTHLQFSQCELSSQQLADLAELGTGVSIVNCKFNESEIRQLKATFESEIHIWGSRPSMVAQFVDATDAFAFETRIGLHIGSYLSDRDMSAVWSLLEKTEYAVSLESIGGEPDLEALRKRKNLGRLEISSGDFSMLTDNTPSYSEYFFLLLETEAQVAGRVDSNKLFWELALGAKGKFKPLVFANSDLLSGFGSIDDSPFAWKMNPSGELEKLWLPQSINGIDQKIANPKSLKEISFDIRWLDNEDITEDQSFATSTWIRPEPFLNNLTNLEALYLSEREVVDLSALNALTGLETIQFSSSSSGFRRDLFPKLKEVRVVMDKPIKNGLMKELKAIETLERLVVIDTHTTTFTEEQFLKQARTLLGDQVEVSVVDSSDSGQLAPDDFKQHRIDIRQRCVEKYLKLPDGKHGASNAQ